MASSPRHTMLANLRRRQAQAEAAEAENDRTAADAHWRGVQSHAKQLAPYDPETAVPVLEAVMARFEALAAESTGYDADLYFNLAQGAAADLAPLKIARVRPDLEPAAEGAARARASREEAERLRAELEGLSPDELQRRYDELAADAGPGTELHAVVQRLRGTGIKELGRMYLQLARGEEPLGRSSGGRR